MPTDICIASMSTSQNLGDGYCEDKFNNKRCNYDGGDCCGSCVNTRYCTDNCECHLEEGSYNMAGSWSIYIGNGYCDDYLNKADCNFDAGDCCGPNVITDYCYECQCLVNEGCYLNSTQRCKIAFFGWDISFLMSIILPQT